MVLLPYKCSELIPLVSPLSLNPSHPILLAFSFLTYIPSSPASQWFPFTLSFQSPLLLFHHHGFYRFRYPQDHCRRPPSPSWGTLGTRMWSRPVHQYPSHYSRLHSRNHPCTLYHSKVLIGLELPGMAS